ncbi:hypothetical protein [Streptomyces sp. FIT100]|uniref:hypothetical protein n=1 Tax=Streptomyces sp. FIT100 TaxID=2837956 RepID=UPI0021C58852|nr:hypothetical protein [Streptomyces sp. FIT100]UUN28817.1 hypothetical protein KK483_22360 [Streptomyces sp. FIT100]
MSRNMQVKAVLEYIEIRERELAEQAGQIRVRLEELTAQPAELEAESENSHVTHKTLLALPTPASADEPDRPDVPDHPDYQQILTVLADTSQPMRAREVCQALDLPIIAKNTEGIRAKLNRLVARGILAEPEPGLFAPPST